MSDRSTILLRGRQRDGQSAGRRQDRENAGHRASGQTRSLALLVVKSIPRNDRREYQPPGAHLETQLNLTSNADMSDITRYALLSPFEEKKQSPFVVARSKFIFSFYSVYLYFFYNSKISILSALFLTIIIYYYIDKKGSKYTKINLFINLVINDDR